MLTNAKILAKAFMICLLLSVTGTATAQNFSFENCRLLSLEKSIKWLFQGSLESGLKFYPSNQMFSFDNSSVNWGNRKLMWKGQNRQGYFFTYFNAPQLQVSDNEEDVSRLNLKLFSNGTGEIILQKNHRQKDNAVQFICGSGGQTNPEPERSAITEEAANCYLNPSSIRQAQQHLKSLGLYKSTIDGVSGRGTKAAIKKAKKIVGRKASAGDCITAKDITEFSLLAEAAVVVEELTTNADQDDASETEGPIPEASNYQLSETQRLDAQTALKKFGFYNGIIDGSFVHTVFSQTVI